MEKIMIITKTGNVIKFNSKDVPTQLKGGIGTCAVQLRQGDAVISAMVVKE